MRFAGEAESDSMKIHVIFYSMYGHIYQMAEAEAEGVVWSVSSMSGQRVVSILATNVHNRAVAVYWQAFAGDLEHVRREIEPIMRTLRVDALPQR